ncbi:uncharacterized protein NPIL_397311 [Nephila pilipes]|uniref:Uncharacterized protein n=1 Tax=Nephila pilipes TaxID=299642 RepID=A0A8X6TNR4_NEPPI|nr:uncharacterized protein NPIL_397311 [Nephila pilipes]
MVASLNKSTRRFSLEGKISQRSLVRILYRDLGMKPYHLAARVLKEVDYLNDTFRRVSGLVQVILFHDQHVHKLKPCDFWLWGMDKDRDYASKLCDLDYLKHCIMSVIVGIPSQMAERALQTTMDIHKCIERHGCQIEILKPNPCFNYLVIKSD